MALSDAASVTGAVRAATLGSRGVGTVVVAAVMDEAFEVAAPLGCGWRDVGARGGGWIISDMRSLTLGHDSDRARVVDIAGMEL